MKACPDCLSEIPDAGRGSIAGRSPAHDLYATGTTGGLLTAGLCLGADARGTLGGDQQVGAAIVEGRIDFVIFFWNPLEPHRHDVDVKALLRIAVVYNIPIACNRSTADFLLSSPLMQATYERRLERRHISQTTELSVQVR